MHVANYVYGALDRFEARRAFDEALLVPVAGTLSMSNTFDVHGVAFDECSLKLLSPNPCESKKSSRSQRRSLRSLAAAPFVLPGLAALGSPRVFRWTRAATGRMKFGRPCARGAVLRSNVKWRVRAPGFSGIVAASRVESMTHYWRRAAFRGGRFLPGFNGVCTHLYRRVGIRPINLFLAPTRLASWVLMTRMRICCLRGRPRNGGTLRSKKDSA